MYRDDITTGRLLRWLNLASHSVGSREPIETHTRLRWYFVVISLSTFQKNVLSLHEFYYFSFSLHRTHWILRVVTMRDDGEILLWAEHFSLFIRFSSFSPVSLRKGKVNFLTFMKRCSTLSLCFSFLRREDERIWKEKHKSAITWVSPSVLWDQAAVSPFSCRASQRFFLLKKNQFSSFYFFRSSTHDCSRVLIEC